ncbi:UDP-N-acetylmuramate--L-alanine ligase [Sporobacter termitidis DSM 10068]|uniref:UDP-N-acetylmuramate--L-alanine ligase n=2 Tax=Sporobacter TaxID=44748 RepID=A0A1M5UPX2_9FIRM|nr:UDP-N-acetylmuramate--L-alanine ligase [Sporobacter termitidis DSM 10068]
MKSGFSGHLVGIGGVSMSPLAEVLYKMGVPITGSDMNDSDAVHRLRALGIDVKIGHKAGNIGGARFIIRTAAAREDNVEIAAARKAGIPVFERAEAWGYIMRGYKNAVCVAGTHGKTTTTSMTTHILLAADADPTVMIGGTLNKLQSGYRVGAGDVIVLESCEYYNSFHSFFPTIAVVLNVDADHLDFFKDLDDIKASFRHFASLVPENGHIVCNGDDANTMDALRPLGRPLFTFGTNEQASVRAVNIEQNGSGSSFDVLYNGALYCHVILNVPGRQNVMNALAAAATAITLNIPPAAVTEGLLDFTGAGRRFEYKGSVKGADVYDDYAHHPRELHALLDAVESLGYDRVILAFQPHTYTRTKAFFDDFISELKRADLVFLAEIYAAREKNTIGISSRDLAEKVPGAVYCPSFDDIEARLCALAGKGDIILTVGAGDIYKVGEHLTGKAASVG